MTIYGMTLGLGWALAAFVSLVLVLRHLKALHLTKTQAVELRQGIDTWTRIAAEDIHRLGKELADTNAKLSALSNRVR